MIELILDNTAVRKGDGLKRRLSTTVDEDATLGNMP